MQHRIFGNKKGSFWQQNLTGITSDQTFYTTFSEADVHEYAKCISACAVNILTGFYCDKMDPNLIMLERQRIAVEHLHRHFFFVGLFEYWCAMCTQLYTVNNSYVSSSALVLQEPVDRGLRTVDSSFGGAF